MAYDILLYQVKGSDEELQSDMDTSTRKFEVICAKLEVPSVMDTKDDKMKFGSTCDKAGTIETWRTSEYCRYEGFGYDVMKITENVDASHKLVPSCFAIFDLEPLTLSLDFVLMYEIFKSLSFRLDRLCRLAILCLDQHAHTLHHLESLLTISLDRLDILKEDLFEHEHVVMNPTSAGMRHLHLHLYMNPEIK
ncbi:hypothetical protein Tco_0232969 [Tanacetum coccineum]